MNQPQIPPSPPASVYKEDYSVPSALKMFETGSFEEDEEQDNTVDYFLNKLRTARDNMGKRKGPATIWLRENEPVDIIPPQEYDLSNGIPTMSRSLADFEQGIAILTGLPNSGKSTLMMNMELQSLELNPDLICVDLSFDDPVEKRYQQWMAARTGLYYQDISSDTDLAPNLVAKKEAAHAWLESMVQAERLHIYSAVDTFQGKDKSSIEVEFLKISNVMKLMSRMRRRYPDKPIAMFVDSWNDLDLQAGRTDSEVQAADAAAKRLKQKAEATSIRLWISAHLRKTQGREPALEDLKGSGYLAYAAVWVGIVRNEYRENSMNDPLMYQFGNKLVPMLTVRPGTKNKVSTWDMPLYYGFLAGQGTIIPLTREEYEIARAESMGKVQARNNK